MPNPERIGSTFYLRVHVPEVVRDTAAGKKLFVPIGSKTVEVTIGKVVKVSLQTKDADEAKQRFTKALAAVQEQWQTLQKNQSAVPHRNLVALAGQHYHSMVNVVAEEPGEPRIWEAFSTMLDRVEDRQANMLQWYGDFADRLLLQNGFNADDYSRLRLIDELHKAARQAGVINLRRANGDYRPDPDASRYPELEQAPVVEPLQTQPKGITTINSLFFNWERDHLSEGKSPRTVLDFRHKVQALIKYLGHDDAQRVTPENIADWCNHLRHEQNLSGRTVSQKYLSVVKLVFGLAVEQRKLKENPAAGSRVRYAKPVKTRPSGFTDQEASAILQAALVNPKELGRRSEENKRAIRWGPWICAFTGARITEVMQIRTDDLVEQHGIQCLRITPDAGSVKARTFRVVPLHPQLLTMGLPEMIRELPPGPVFYPSAPGKGKALDPVERAQNAGAKVGQWVGSIIGPEAGKVQPNHAWRHRFKTIAREVGIDLEVRDAIQGHEDGRAASDYGEVSVRAMWSAIQKLPRIDVGTSAEWAASQRPAESP